LSLHLILFSHKNLVVLVRGQKNELPVKNIPVEAASKYCESERKIKIKTNDQKTSVREYFLSRLL
jgi:hypothetical protein